MHFEFTIIYTAQLSKAHSINDKTEYVCVYIQRDEIEKERIEKKRKYWFIKSIWMCARLYFIYFLYTNDDSDGDDVWESIWLNGSKCIRHSQQNRKYLFEWTSSIIIICCNQIFAYLISFRFAPCTLIVPLYFMPMFNIEMHFNDGPKRLSMRFRTKNQFQCNCHYTTLWASEQARAFECNLILNVISALFLSNRELKRVFPF